MAYHYAKDLEVSKCWVCSQIPHHSSEGVTMLLIACNSSVKRRIPRGQKFLVQDHPHQQYTGTDPSWSNTGVHEAPTPTHHLGLVAHGNTCYLKANATCYMGQSNCTKTINCQNDTRRLFDNSQNCELTSSSIYTSLGAYFIRGILAYLWLPRDRFGSRSVRCI